MNKRRLSDDADEFGIKIRKVDDEGKLNFFKAPSSLKDTAAIKITLTLWYHQLLRDSRTRDNFYGNLCYDSMEESYIHMTKSDDYYYGYDHGGFRNTVLNAITKLPIPLKLIPCIESNVRLIENQLKNWLCYHEHRIFFSSDYNSTHSAYDLIEEIIWRSDGYIDYMATAENLLESPLLSDIVKFRVMCTYCLEDEIVQFPDYIINPKYLNRVTFDSHPLIFYWNCYLKRELDKIDFGEATSIENYIINKVDNWAAIEYFFDKLSVDDQVVKATVLIRSHGLKYQSRVLSKLNESQQHRVFMDCAKSILMNYLNVPSSKPFIFDLWNRCKNLITEKEFFDIFQVTMRNLSWKEYNDSQYTVSLLTEIWTTVPAELKKNAESMNFRNMFTRFIEDYDIINAGVLELLLVMLPDASNEYKAGVLHSGRNFFYNLLKRFQPHYLDKLLKILCSDAEQLAVQKKSFMRSENSKHHCSELIREGNPAKLSDILTTFVPDTERICYKMEILELKSVIDYFTGRLLEYDCENLKKIIGDEVIPIPPADIIDYKLKLFESEKVTEFCISELLTDKSKKLRKLIDDVFESDPNTANGFVLRISTMDEAIEKFREKINAEELNRVKDSLEQFITREEDLKAVKDKLLQSYLKIIRGGVFSTFGKVEWKDFLTWCSTDLKQFKKSLVLEELFNNMLTKSVSCRFDTQLRKCDFKVKCCFNELDTFLAWYFDTPQEIKAYKIDKAFNFKRMELIDVLLRKSEKYHLRSVLTWFFDKDYDEIGKFRIAHAKHKISSFI